MKKAMKKVGQNRIFEMPFYRKNVKIFTYFNRLFFQMNPIQQMNQIHSNEYHSFKDFFEQNLTGNALKKTKRPRVALYLPRICPTLTIPYIPVIIIYITHRYMIMGITYIYKHNTCAHTHTGKEYFGLPALSALLPFLTVISNYISVLREGHFRNREGKRAFAK